MNASDIMTTEVVAVRPDMPAREVARLLLDRGISAVPVVDDEGLPIGIVSEGDLIGRNDTERHARRDWWLTLAAEGGALSDELLAGLRAAERTAREVMTAPVVTVGEDTPVEQIASLLRSHRIKRVPVVRNGRIVGIVSRADLLQAVAAPSAPAATAQRSGFLPAALAGLDEMFLHRRPQAERPAESGAGPVLVSQFRNLVTDYEQRELQHRDAARRAAAEQRRSRMSQLVEHHVTDEEWRRLLHQARDAAQHGEKEYLLLRFPSEFCSDAGRAINAGEPDWPATLRGEAGEIFLRWERDLKPHGFHLGARVLDYPGGMPGDIGLYLIWSD